jgi:hypothetical protein
MAAALCWANWPYTPPYLLTQQGDTATTLSLAEGEGIHSDNSVIPVGPMAQHAVDNASKNCPEQ